MRDVEGTDRDRSVIGSVFHSIQPVWFAERMHQPIGPAEDCNRVDKVEDLQVVEADLAQMVELVGADIVGMRRQVDAEIEQRLLEFREVRVKAAAIDLVHHLRPLSWM